MFRSNADLSKFKTTYTMHGQQNIKYLVTHWFMVVRKWTK